MDIQKQREAFEAYLLSQGVDLKYMPCVYFNGTVYDQDDGDEDYQDALGEINLGWNAWQEAQKVAVPEWISVEDRLPELKGVWRTSLPLYVQIEGFGISLAYPCKWMNEPFCWIPANIMCNGDQEYAPVNDKNQLIGVTHWVSSPKEPTHD